MPAAHGPAGKTTRFLDLNNGTDQQVKATPGELLGWHIANTTAGSVYVKLYDKASAINPASDVPVMTLFFGAGMVSNVVSAGGLHRFDNAIRARCVTEVGDTGTTSPAANGCVANFFVK